MVYDSSMIRNSKNLGFTLIELLIVIAIIGILSGLILAGISLSRDRSEDVRIKSGIRQLRVLAEDYFDGNSYSYVDYDDCVETPDATTCHSQDISDKIVTLITDIEDGNNLPGSVDAAAATQEFCLTAPLKSDPTTYVCTDISGQLFEDTSASSPCGGGTPTTTCTYN